ncbi:hypothetical protein GCM10023166_03300 [Paeniglutamicibacter cryotolerans]|uniref:Uncharacterized protein n=3 Tax=Paeniglutamicibacter cryotolerans TaxID=670079 RepID=A0A839QKN0_9MICC|nr:hypothetical protein [Paeniglutamicibacter cryotolerans]
MSLSRMRYRRRRTAAEPKWLSAVAPFEPWTSFGFGCVPRLRPNAILLAAAGNSLRSCDRSLTEVPIIFSVYTIIAASSVTAPVIGVLVAPARTQELLVSARTWIARNNQIVSILILKMIGLVIIGNNRTRL